MVLRAYHRATHEGDFATAQGLLAWLAGQPHTDRSVLRSAGTRGKVDGQASLTFLAGLLQLLRQSGYGGLVVVLDEVETIQRMNSQTREKSLNALRHRVVVRRPALSTDLTRSEGVRLPGTDASMQVAMSARSLVSMRWTSVSSSGGTTASGATSAIRGMGTLQCCARL